MNLTISGDLLSEVIEHARTCHPREGCGFLVGRTGVANRFVPMPNRLGSSTAFEIDPALLFQFFRSLRQSGEDLVAIYHSHPHGEAYPSKRDVENAFYPDCFHLIVSPADFDRPKARVFRIVEGSVLEGELHVTV